MRLALLRRKVWNRLRMQLQHIWWVEAIVPLDNFVATSVCASWQVAVVVWFWLFVPPLSWLILTGISGRGAACLWIVCLAVMACTVAAPYFSWGPPDTFSFVPYDVMIWAIYGTRLDPMQTPDGLPLHNNRPNTKHHSYLHARVTHRIEYHNPISQYYLTSILATTMIPLAL